MASEVRVLFVGDPSQIFQTADAVEARLNNLGSGTNSGGLGVVNDITTSLKSGTTELTAFANQTDKSAAAVVSSTTKAAAAVDILTAKTRNLNAASKELSASLRANDPFTGTATFNASEAAVLQKRFLARESLTDLQSKFDSDRDAFSANQRFTRPAIAKPVIPQPAPVEQAAINSSAGVATGGLGFSAGNLLAGAAGFAIGKILKDSLAEYDAAQKRSADLRRETNLLGLDFNKTSAEIKTFGDNAHLSFDVAQESFLRLTEISKDTNLSTETLEKNISGFLSGRGVDEARLPDVLKDVRDGIADTNVFGRNAASIFDEYAASIGRTSGQLTTQQKEQALSNELVRVGALHAGEAAANTGQLAKSWSTLLTNIGSGITPAVQTFLNAVNVAAGGGSGNGGTQTFDVGAGVADQLLRFQQGGLIPSTVYAEAIESENQKQKKFFAEFTKNFKANAAAVKSSLDDPNGNLVNFSLSHFLDRQGFGSISPDAQIERQRAAVTEGHKFVDLQKTIFENAFGRGNVGEINSSAKLLNAQQKLFEPQDFENLTKKASSALSQGFRDLISTAKGDVSELRKVLKQVADSPFLESHDKAGLFSSLNEQIDASIKAANEQVKQIRETYERTFDGLQSKLGSDNPFARIFTESTKAIRELRENLTGLNPDLQKTALALQASITARELFKTRVDNAFTALDLRDKAGTFRNFTKPQSSQDFTNNLDQSLRNFGIDATKFKGDDDKAAFLKSNGLDLFFKNNPNASLGAGKSFFDSLTKADPNKAAQDRLDKQLQLANSFSPKTEQEKAAIDQKIISIGSSLDPGSLRGDERTQIAAALERQADRVEQREADAAKVRDSQLNTQQNIALAVKGLLDIATKKGTAGVEEATKLNITLENKTNKATDISTPTPRDVSLGYSSSAKGLTNF